MSGVTGRWQERLTGMRMCGELGEVRNGDWWWCPVVVPVGQWLGPGLGTLSLVGKRHWICMQPCFLW